MALGYCDQLEKKNIQFFAKFLVLHSTAFMVSFFWGGKKSHDVMMHDFLEVVGFFLFCLVLVTDLVQTLQNFYQVTFARGNL